jgi:hypothetical protein
MSKLYQTMASMSPSRRHRAYKAPSGRQRPAIGLRAGNQSVYSLESIIWVAADQKYPSDQHSSYWENVGIQVVTGKKAASESRISGDPDGDVGVNHVQCDFRDLARPSLVREHTTSPNKKAPPWRIGSPNPTEARDLSRSASHNRRNLL